MRRLLAGLLITAASCSVTFAQVLTLTRTAVSGMDSLLAHEHAWDRNCNARETKITITKKPQHGAVSIVQGASTIPDSVPRTGNTGPCAGKTITGNEVLYKSADGFHGMDSLSYVVQYPDGQRSPTTITITVN
ncbi:MAG TPA: hypothetical protein VKW08_15485 [Xanthobacteraceae bacterium]|nr:hypothetical protein [Xanthobacteraceae bacterium]